MITSIFSPLLLSFQTTVVKASRSRHRRSRVLGKRFGPVCEKWLLQPPKNLLVRTGPPWWRSFVDKNKWNIAYWKMNLVCLIACPQWDFFYILFVLMLENRYNFFMKIHSPRSPMQELDVSFLALVIFFLSITCSQMLSTAPHR